MSVPQVIRKKNSNVLINDSFQASKIRMTLKMCPKFGCVRISFEEVLTSTEIVPPHCLL